MSDVTDLQMQIVDLTRRVETLERQRWEGSPRLGPKPPTSDEMADRLVDAVKDAIDKTEPPPVDRSKVCTTSGRPADLVRAEQTNETGQHKDYIVLCEEERKKGFVRPYRDAYKHVGPRICGKTLPPVAHPDDREHDRVCFMDPGHSGDCGDASGLRPRACNTVTTMGRALSESYARDPKFYDATFCCGCNRHLPVNEFVWTADGQEVGS